MSKKLHLRRYPLIEAIQAKRDVMGAVILRDMRSRFFNHGLGFLVQCIWPLAHLLIIMGINIVAGRSAPYGNSVLFFSTGLLPTLTFIYISRFMGLSVVINQQMLSFPIIKITDILYGRAVLEVIAGFGTLVLLWAILVSLGISPYPDDPGDAALAYLATILLALGIGTIVGVITQLLPLFVTVYALVVIVLYISSGSLFVAAALPDQIAIPLSYNPVLQSVEWMRKAYFENYSDRILNREYVVWFGVTSLMVGLILERFLRRFVMDNM